MGLSEDRGRHFFTAKIFMLHHSRFEHVSLTDSQPCFYHEQTSLTIEFTFTKHTFKRIRSLMLKINIEQTITSPEARWSKADVPSSAQHVFCWEKGKSLYKLGGDILQYPKLEIVSLRKQCLNDVCHYAVKQEMDKSC